MNTFPLLLTTFALITQAEIITVRDMHFDISTNPQTTTTTSTNTHYCSTSPSSRTPSTFTSNPTYTPNPTLTQPTNTQASYPVYYNPCPSHLTTS